MWTLCLSHAAMVKRGEGCSLLLKHSRGKVTAMHNTSQNCDLIAFFVFISHDSQGEEEEEEDAKKEEGGSS